MAQPESNFQALLQTDSKIRPPAATAAGALVPNYEAYYEAAMSDIEAYWDKVARTEVDWFRPYDAVNLRLVVEYYDRGSGSFGVQYDSNDASAPLSGAYTESGKRVQLTGNGGWKVAAFDLPGARAANRQEGQSDFRIATDLQDLVVGRVYLLVR